eukprot:CAMPEP_0197185998 /NCGR_PEP_ID=MMETSP1423-20130617/13011_1 /TAXON_ID=476441 /ORGANISM="Pseudo-nitzschia heimii, Strain UNC1101" /LENGTH=541 /DNA_ID=CAMNT_0042637195 /DNA_START=546 /DNA_END=2171 /DNA_ORIENTATION=-
MLYRQDISSTSDQNTDETTQRIAELERELESCKELLPIQSLRRDLKSHYNEYLNHFLEVCIRNGGAGRCLVEMMPVPIADDSASYVFQLLPSKIKQRHSDSLHESMLEILRLQSSFLRDESGKNSSIIGIAMFEGGRLLHSFPNSERYDLLNSDLCLLMAYMASYKAKMGGTTKPINRTTSSPSSSLTEPQSGLLKRLAFHFGPMVDKMPSKTATPVKCKDTDPFSTSSPENYAHCRGQFLSSPPSFMFRSSEDVSRLIFDNNKQDIWAPRVHFPLNPRMKEICNKDFIYDHQVTTRVVVFEFLGFSFMIFIDFQSRNVECEIELPKTLSLLMNLGEKLSNAIIQTFHDEPCASLRAKSMPTHISSELGQDIILVEHAKGRMCLIQSHRQISKRVALREKTRGKSLRFAALGQVEEKSFSQSTPSSSRCKTMEWSALGLDCRHLLASRLPLDICLAFDDMINEIRDAEYVSSHSLATKESNNNELSTSLLELCTCMPYGWIYALATEGKEIFVLFDGSIYVTVADVQSAVLSIKEKFNITA